MDHGQEQEMDELNAIIQQLIQNHPPEYDYWCGKQLRIKLNDPDLTKLTLGDQDFSGIISLIDWGYLGTIIGDNTHIKELEFNINWAAVGGENCLSFFEGLARNRSIQKMTVWCSFVDWETLVPFFVNNRNFQTLCLYNGIRDMSTMFWALGQCSSLEEFTSTCSYLSDEESYPLFNALKGHRRLHSLDVSYNEIGKKGCSALANLIQNPVSELVTLDLRQNSINVDSLAMLLKAMTNNRTMRHLNLGTNSGITTSDWGTIFHLASSTTLSDLDISNNEFNDKNAAVLSTVLTRRGNNFRRLAMADMNPIDEDLYDTDYEAALEAERNKRSLFTMVGWQSIFEALRHPNCMLEELILNENDFNDEIITALATSLVGSNRPLKKLALTGARNIANTAWRMLAYILCNRGSALEKLDLRPRVDRSSFESFAKPFAQTLGSNSKVTECILCEPSDNITCWDMLEPVVCNSATIMDTYLSNHTVEKLMDGDVQPPALQIYLKLNENHTKTDAARLKVIKCHFHGDYDLQPFMGMALKVLPHAIAWLAKESVNTEGIVDGLPLMYHFVHNMHHHIFYKHYSDSESNVDPGRKKQKMSMTSRVCAR